MTMTSCIQQFFQLVPMCFLPFNLWRHLMLWMDWKENRTKLKEVEQTTSFRNMGDLQKPCHAQLHPRVVWHGHAFRGRSFVTTNRGCINAKKHHGNNGFELNSCGWMVRCSRNHWLKIVHVNWKLSQGMMCKQHVHWNAMCLTQALSDTHLTFMMALSNLCFVQTGVPTVNVSVKCFLCWNNEMVPKMQTHWKRCCSTQIECRKLTDKQSFCHKTCWVKWLSAMVCLHASTRPKQTPHICSALFPWNIVVPVVQQVSF